MADTRYFDTSALLDWAESIAPNPPTHAASVGSQVFGLIDAGADTCGISEVALIEYQHHACGWWRRTDNEDGRDYKVFDRSWMSDQQDQLMAWIASGYLTVRDVTHDSFAAAMTWLQAIIRDHENDPKVKKKFGSWDMVHLAEAVRWAREIDEQVILVTADTDFEEFISIYDGFDNFVIVERLT